MGEQIFPNSKGDLKDSAMNPPVEWFDDSTMEGLFGPLNRPEKVEFWRKLIINTFSKHPTYSARPIFSVHLLESIYKRKGLTPVGIKDAIV